MIIKTTESRESHLCQGLLKLNPDHSRSHHLSELLFRADNRWLSEEQQALRGKRDTLQTLHRSVSKSRLWSGFAFAP